MTEVVKGQYYVKSNDRDEKDRKPGKNELDRRTFFAKLGLGSLSIAAAGTAVFSYQYLSPNVLYEPSPIINLGKPESFPLDSVTEDVNSGIYVIHSREGFFVLQAICTHLGCLTAWKPELGIIACPCHGSKFFVSSEGDRRPGDKIEGPAPRPLPWKKMWINEDGDLMVDRSTEIPPMQFVRV
jgi:cytochrome b6-f complex iron-sulfur subunit